MREYSSNSKSNLNQNSLKPSINNILREYPLGIEYFFNNLMSEGNEGFFIEEYKKHLENSLIRSHSSFGDFEEGVKEVVLNDIVEGYSPFTIDKCNEIEVYTFDYLNAIIGLNKENSLKEAEIIMRMTVKNVDKVSYQAKSLVEDLKIMNSKIKFSKGSNALKKIKEMIKNEEVKIKRKKIKDKESQELKKFKRILTSSHKSLSELNGCELLEVNKSDKSRRV